MLYEPMTQFLQNAEKAHVMTLRRSLTVLALVVLCASPAAAAPITTLQFTIERPAPLLPIDNISFKLSVFDAPVNLWPGPFTPAANAGPSSFAAGQSTFFVDVSTPLDTAWFTIYGEYNVNLPNHGVYIADTNPPLNNGLPIGYGPPWISLAPLLLGQNVHGRFETIIYDGRNNGVGNLGSYTITAVPEPASLLLLGTGLAALAARRSRSRRAEPEVRRD
jgi:hypothetical protein